MPKIMLQCLNPIWLLFLIMIQGCSQFKAAFILPEFLPQQVEAATPDQIRASEITTDERLTLLTHTLSYHEQIKSYSREHLAIERHRLETSPETSTAYANIKLALLYSLPGSDFYSDAKARKLLKNCMKKNRSTHREYFYLASMMYTFLDTRIAQRQSINSIRSKLDVEQIRNTELQEQLEALKAIEKSINIRSNSLTSFHYP